MFNVIFEQVLYYTAQSAINIDHNRMVNKYRLREMGPRHLRQKFRGTMPHLICLSISFGLFHFKKISLGEAQSF